MGELPLQAVQISKLLAVAVAAGCYGYGGVINKSIRRFGASAVFTLAALGFGYLSGNFSWWFAAWFPGLAIAFSIGYGQNSWLMNKLGSKWKVRAVVGAVIALTSLAIAIPMASWVLLALHGLFCVVGSAILGAVNPTQSARAEETMIGAIAGFVPLLGMI